MKSKEARLNNIIGQLEGVKKMLSSNADCISVLTQLKAIKSAVGGIMDTVMDEQLDTCMKSLKDKDKKLLVKMRSYVRPN